MAQLLRAEPQQAPQRFRAFYFQKPLGPWRPRRVLALQDAIDAGHGTREWETGQIYTDGPVRIAQQPGDAPCSPAQHRLAQALAFHRKHGGSALIRARTQLAAAEAAGSDDAACELAEVVEELRTLHAEAMKAERRRQKDASY